MLTFFFIIITSSLASFLALLNGNGVLVFPKRKKQCDERHSSAGKKWKRIYNLRKCPYFHDPDTRVKKSLFHSTPEQKPLKENVGSVFIIMKSFQVVGTSNFPIPRLRRCNLHASQYLMSYILRTYSHIYLNPKNFIIKQKVKFMLILGLM